VSLVDRLLGAGGQAREGSEACSCIASDLASEEALRQLLREAATKDDVRRLEEKLEALRGELAGVRERMATREELRAEIHRLGERMDTLMQWMIGLLATIWGTVDAIGVMAPELPAG